MTKQGWFKVGVGGGRLASAVVFALAALAGCGGDDDGATDGMDAAVDAGMNARVRVLTANIATFADGFPGATLLEAVEAASPDIVVIQEPGEASTNLATSLGFTRTALTLPSRLAEVLSRYPVAATHDGAVDVTICPDATLRVVPFHGNYRPAEPLSYGPYALRDMPALTEEEIIAAQVTEHGAEVTAALNAANLSPDATATIIAGDFNEPSHLDWVEAAKSLHLDRVVAWPSSVALADAGFTDSFRALRPDPLNDPGDTWTPFPFPNEVHDRIDFIYHRGAKITPVETKVVGESAENADIVVTPYPSDHRFVVVEFELDGVSCP